MKWREISKEMPPHGELIWVWDIHNHRKFLIRHMGCENTWINNKDSNSVFPIWAKLNENDGEF